MSKFIYMDNAATTAVRQEVVDAYTEQRKKKFQR